MGDLVEDYYKKGKRVGCKGEPYPDDPAPTKNMKKLIDDQTRLDAMAVNTKSVFETGTKS